MAAVIPLRQPSPDWTPLSAAIEGFFAAVDLGDETQKVYEATLLNLEQVLAVDVALVDIDRATIQEHLMTRYGHLAPATYNRNLATISSLFTWCVENDLIVASPVKGIRRRKQRTTIETERQARPIDVEDLTAIWTDRRHPLRDRVFWAMAYDTAARADELLGLNIENINVENREAIIIGKGGSAERI